MSAINEPSNPRAIRREHPFRQDPHSTLIVLTIPVLASLVAEPITGLVDTHWVSRLGAGPQTALGIATTLLSSIFWIFNFLGIGTQTSIARGRGGDDTEGRDRICGVALTLAGLLGVLSAIMLLPCLPWIATAMNARGATLDATVTYASIRLLGSPALLLTSAAFGALRGLEDMRAPLSIAIGVNVINAVLDPLLIFGAGPFPAAGLAGAAWASVIAQWLGALAALSLLRRSLRLRVTLDARTVRSLAVVGRDLLVRTGLLSAFLIWTTAVATRAGDDAGASHQAIRQVWILMALVLDAFAMTAQSLVAFFIGSRDPEEARRVARVTIGWSLGTSVLLTIGLLLATPWVESVLIPASARSVFRPAWIVASLSMPINAVSFATDGIHWGTGDFAFLRNVVLLATLTGGLALVVALAIAPAMAPAALLVSVWCATALWVGVRAVLGFLRITPGIGGAPLTVRR